MAGELTFSTPGLTGSTLYAVIRRASDGQVRDVVAGAWEAWDDASIGDYDVAMVEQGASGRWLGTLPAGVSGTPYTYEVCKRAGGSPAVTDPVVGQGSDGNVAGDVHGKVLGGGSGTITGIGAWAAGASGAALALASAVAAVAADVWTYVTRTLTQGAASVVTAVTGTTVTVYKGAQWSVSLTGLTDFTSYSKIYLTVKSHPEGTADAASTVMIQKSTAGTGDGLLYLDGAAIASPVVITDGAITVVSSTSITVTVKAAATSLVDAGDYLYDVWCIIGGQPTPVSEGGVWRILTAVTRATS